MSKYTIITNFNFNTISDFKGPNYTYVDFKDYGFKRETNTIKFYTNFIGCPCIYWIKDNDKWAFSFDYRLVVEFCKENNIAITDNYENLNQLSDNIKSHLKTSIKESYKYGLNYIENWKEVSLFSDGTFTKIDYNLPLFSLDVVHNYDKLKHFLLKYKNAIKNLVDKNLFIPTLTAGLDTRGLSGLWREYKDQLPGYFLTDVKHDGKNHTEQGLAEIDIAEDIVAHIGMKDIRFNDLYDGDDKYIVTLTGMLNENCIAYENPNDPDYVYKIIQHSYGKNTYDKKLVPFIDDEYLMFMQNRELFRILLVCLLAKDLIHIPFLSGTSMYIITPYGQQLWPAFNPYFNMIADIFKYWGKDKVENILKED